jgi:antitoxin (DNA-binding transcriptional repressor) of toxin-antitoxin stability system
MKQVRSEQLRRGLRWLLTEVERGGVIEVLRYQDPVAVMVSPDWYRRAIDALSEQAAAEQQRREAAIAAALRRKEAAQRATSD